MLQILLILLFLEAVVKTDNHNNTISNDNSNGVNDGDSAFDNFEDDNLESSCQCVPPHLCADNDNSANGNGFLDIRFEDDTCPNYYEVCCEMPIKSVETDSSKARKSCGLRNSQAFFAPRITSNSELTEFGELPWTVLVLQRERKVHRNAFMCGGSLIHPQVVITAGHCVHDSKNSRIKVRAGEWNIRNRDEPLPHQDKIVDLVLIHPHYKPGILWNDIALLFLSEPLKEASNIGFICLPPRGLKYESAGLINKCLTSGWGKSAPLRGRHSSILKKVSVPLVSRNKCLLALRKTRLGKFYKLHRSFICAGGEKNRDACKGDGGSPLICPVPGQADRFFQMGVVSWGIGCGANRTPGVYVNVPLFTDWIDAEMNSRNLSTNYYKY